MSRNAQTQGKEGSYTNHAATHGKFAKYLEDENPNCPADLLSKRFAEEWDVDRRKASLSRLRANYSCPDCDSSAVFYTETIGVAQCDKCGLRITEPEGQ